MKKRKFFILTLAALMSILIVIRLMNLATEGQAYIKPEYLKEDISSLIVKDGLTDEDYKTLFYQTGLGKIAIDDLLSQGQTGRNEIINFQNIFFAERTVKCEKIGIITYQESFVNSDSLPVYGFNLAPYKDGYVLITKATHSLGWRHGHAAIVTDAENEETLEAIILGQNSQFQNINKWRAYPSFMMLKLKDSSDDVLFDIAQFAKKYMDDLPYRLTQGMFGNKNPLPDMIKGTQCSHLVWYPFMQHGYDIDSDGTWLVTPKDIANSDLFDIVQIYGVDPSDIWP